jgi:serine protease Do
MKRFPSEHAACSSPWAARPWGHRLPAKWTLPVLIVALAAPLLAQVPPPVPPPPPGVFQRGGYLGVGLQEINAERAKALKLREEGGVEITSVIRESPAEKAGLKPGDVVVAFNGQKIESIGQFSRMVRETPAGREIKLDIVRNGAPQTVPVKIDIRAMPRVFTNDGGHFNFPDVPMPDIPRLFAGLHSPMLGIEAESVDGQLAEYFGVKDGGVLVRSVLKNSAAEKAGLKAGDVILRLDDVKVTSAADISAKLRMAPGKTVQVSLMRDHKETTIPITPDSPERTERNSTK